MVLSARYISKAVSRMGATSPASAPSKESIAVPILKPLLENILRTTLEDIEDSIESVEDVAALSELRRQLTISIAELERVKSVRLEQGITPPYLSEDVAA